MDCDKPPTPGPATFETILRQAQLNKEREAAGRPADFDLDQAWAMIESGKELPPALCPHITELRLSGSLDGKSDFFNLAPLPALTNLRTLFCDNTAVSDLTPKLVLRGEGPAPGAGGKFRGSRGESLCRAWT